MALPDITLQLAGESGEGVISGGDILTTGAARAGYWGLTFRTYPAEIKGGPCMFQVRIGADTRTDANKLCADLHKLGGAFMVLRNSRGAVEARSPKPAQDEYFTQHP